MTAASRVHQELQLQQRELLAALNLHLRSREALELAAGHLADLVAEKVREWQQSGLLQQCNSLRQALSRMDSARGEVIRAERFVLEDGWERLKRARMEKREAEQTVIREMWKILDSLGNAAGSGR